MSDKRDDEQRPVRVDELDVFEDIYLSVRRFAAVVADLDVDPDDLVHDALVATLKQQRISEIRQPAAYLKRAVLNAAVGHRRKAARLRRYLPRLGQDVVVNDHYPSDLGLLDSLSPLDRAVVFMADVEGIPHAVVAEELGLSPSAVRKRVSRGRERLRKALGDVTYSRVGSEPALEQSAKPKKEWS